MNALAHKLLNWTQDVGLLIIAIATVIAMGIEITGLVVNQNVNLGDLLLLFIYLEVLSMVSIYLDSGKLPVRMPLYIAIWRMLAVASAALLIAATIMLIRYGHIKFPYPKSEE